MRHIRRMLIAILLLIIGLMTTHAQEPEWEAWVYNSDNGRMVRIGSNNVIYEDLTLPNLPDTTYSWQAIASPNGNIIVYGLLNTQTQTQTIYAYNTVQDKLIASYSVQGSNVAISLDLIPTDATFSPNGNSVALGVTANDRWSIIVMDLVSQPGAILHQIQSTDANMATLESMNVVPGIVRYDGETIDFMLIRLGTEWAYTYNHYAYNILNRTLTQNYYLTTPAGDFSDRTGMRVMPMSDYRLPNVRDDYNAFGQQVNALHIWYPNTDETLPIFNAENRSLSNPHFIQNSERILVVSYDWIRQQEEFWIIQPNNPTPTTMTTLRNIYPSGIEGTGNGFLLAINSNDVADVFPQLASLPNRTGLLSFDTRTSPEGTSVKQVWFGEEGASYKLIWGRDNQMDSRPVPPAWVPIGAPINASNYDTLTGDSSAQTTQPDAGLSLQIGSEARIFTTEGDRVNVRRGAGTAYEVVDQLPKDTVVTVIDGPISSENYIWWQIQTASTTGWVVESAEGVRVLQPTGNIDPAFVPTSVPAISGNNFAIGDRIIITEAGNELNARQSATVNAPVVLVLRTNQVFPITGGPVSADGYVWWQINTSEGLAWVAEGTADEQWIISING